MKCPTCLENFNASETRQSLFTPQHDAENQQYSTRTTTCPNLDCKQSIIFLDTTVFPDNTGLPPGFLNPPHTVSRMIHPRHQTRPNVTLSDVPDKYHEDYNEAVEVLSISAKASAALTRRLLQKLLRDESGVKHDDLNSEIGEAIDTKLFPSRILAKLDQVRVIGNFAVHPIKSSGTGEIVDIEPGEAELNLDVVEMLFDDYFTTPRLEAERNKAINEKLIAAGKPSLEASIEARQKAINKKRQKNQS